MLKKLKNGKREEALDLCEVSRNNVPYFHAWANYTNPPNFHCLFVLGLTGAFSVTFIWILSGAKTFLPQWTKFLEWLVDKSVCINLAYSHPQGWNTDVLSKPLESAILTRLWYNNTPSLRDLMPPNRHV